MSTGTRPTRRPRDWMVEDTEFGKNADVTWHAASTAQEQAELSAAQVQHQLAAYVRYRHWLVDLSVDALGDLLGTGPEQVRRMLRGEVPLRLDRLCKLAEAVEVDVAVSLTTRDLNFENRRADP